MASNRKRSAKARNGQRASYRTQEAAVGVAAALTPEALFTRYSANCVVTLDILHVALDTTSRLQRLQLERSGQALSLTDKAMSALAGTDPAAVFTVQAGLAQDALNQSVDYLERLVALSTDARGQLFELLDRQCRVNGIPGPLPFGNSLATT